MHAQTTTQNSKAWIVVAVGSLILLLSMGPRSAMGFFQLPILNDTGWGRADFGLAMALQNLVWGMGQPFFGAIADRYGTARVLVLSGILYASGLLMMTWTSSILWLNIGGGILIGLGVASASFSIVLTAFSRYVSAEQRSLAFGIGTAAGSAGTFVFAPLSQALISTLDWRHSLTIMAAIMLLIPLLSFFLRGNGASEGGQDNAYKQSMGKVLNQAFGHRSYVLLFTGFFVCGFQVAFITAHFPAYLADIGIDVSFAVIALTFIGLFNIIGSLASGFIGQRQPKAKLLSFIYIGRSIAVTLFLLLPQSPASVIIFSIVMGLLWLSTVPPTNGLVAVMFGTRNLGLLSGIVFFSHQIGSFLGVWLGGFLYDRFGSFDEVWWLGVALGLFAAAVHWPIREESVGLPQPA
ncbi:MFS transporter [Rhizobium sp. L1K21]|uniref:MFS transporter n=1 Tax=Rhizobium sp. L1K21 TaxID=2954933 RepID=UPI0020932949|nr:MFS transporter [Rhizobium sp. L1K21]MCO6186581.1 MFS transporter [Rhizobium sp. L1K21]